MTILTLIASMAKAADVTPYMKEVLRAPNATEAKRRLGVSDAPGGLSFTPQYGTSNLTNWSGVTLFNTNGLASTNYVNTATNGFTTTAYVNTATNGFTTTAYVNAATNGFTTTAYVNTATNGFTTTAYVNTATNGFVTQTVTNGLQGALGFTPQFGDADLTNWAALATSAKQDSDSDLTALAGIAGVNGDLILYNSGWQRLAKGAEGQFLRVGGALPFWDNNGVYLTNLNAGYISGTFASSIVHSNHLFLDAAHFIYPSNLTASRFLTFTAAGGVTNVGLSGANPINQNLTATTFAQISALAPAYVITNGSTVTFSNKSTTASAGGFYMPTGYVAANFAINNTASFLIVSNNYLYFVTKTKTNLIVNGN